MMLQITSPVLAVESAFGEGHLAVLQSHCLCNDLPGVPVNLGTSKNLTACFPFHPRGNAPSPACFLPGF